MDVTSGLHERFQSPVTERKRSGSLNKNDISPPKKDKEDILNKSSEAIDPSGGPLIQRCVIIQRDEKGYGLTISGNNPVFVQSIKEDGAAFRAGVQQGDRIIKVNGTLVTQSNHLEVVKLIRSGSYVALTLLGRPPGQTTKLFPFPASNSYDSHLGIGSKSFGSSVNEHITGPQPVDSEKQLQMNKSRLHTIRKMREEELKFLEKLKCDYNKNPTNKLQTDMIGANKRVKELEDQLASLTANCPDLGVSLITPTTPSSSMAWFSLDKDKLPSPQEYMPLADIMTYNTNIDSIDTFARSCVLSEEEQINEFPQHLENIHQISDQWVSPSPFNPFDDTIEISTCAHNTPPGTPPPAYGTLQESSESHSTGLEEDCLGKTHEVDDTSKFDPVTRISPVNLDAGSNRTSMIPHQVVNIISMEDEEFLFDSDNVTEDHGRFKDINRLKYIPGHLCVFLHYLITNDDPSPLFFFLLVDNYKLGNAKEMKKWAYEIHSTFLIPGAPLKVDNVDENIIKEIDDVLQSSVDKEDSMRVIFNEAYKKASDKIKEQLTEFCYKRNLGFGNLYGPPDQQLEGAMLDKNKEQRIIEQLFAPTLEKLTEDLENASDRNQALAFALTTVLKQFGIKFQGSNRDPNLLERCQTFVAKDKSKFKFPRSNKKVKEEKGLQIKGHNFVAAHYYSVTYCNNCGLIIWGVGNQGYQCQYCDMNIHKNCTKVIEETCVGTNRKKDKKKDERSRVSGIMDSIIKRRPTNISPAAIDKARKLQEDKEIVDSTVQVPLEDRIDQENVDRSTSSSRVEKLINRFQTMEEESSSPSIRDCAVHSAPEAYDREERKTKIIARSESLKTRGTDRKSVRKKSDPSIPRSKSDVDESAIVMAINKSISSSNSSLTTSLESPNSSLEMVHKNNDTSSAFNQLPFQHQHHHDFHDDPDLEVETDSPNWQKSVDKDVFRKLKPKEVKRQDVINELFHTERNHVRNLKILEKVFRYPMEQQQILPQEILSSLFVNIDEMLEIHGAFYNQMKEKQNENTTGVIGDIGDLVLSMFDDEAGDNFYKAVAQFCRCQSIGLETLKTRQKKDQKLAQFLADAESNPLCRRLQLKDIIPTEMQRLTKYPLLLENIAKYTSATSSEYKKLMHAVEQCKHILDQVNQAVKESENSQRLLEIQRKLDKSAFEKASHSPSNIEHRKLDLTRHTMIYEGPLSWRIKSQKCIDLHVVLLADLLVLLQKVDDKLVLKFHTNLISGRENTKKTQSPLISMHGLLAKNVATDKKAFFLISTGDGAQIYELVATTPAEKKAWLKNITDTAEAYKQRHLPPENSSEKLDYEVLSSDSVLGSDIGQISSPLSDTEPCPVDNETISGEEASSISIESTVHLDLGSSLEIDNCRESVSEPVGISCTPESEIIYQHRIKPSKLQRIEHMLEQPCLIYPDEVMSSQGVELGHAQVILTPQEQLKRKDALIQQTLMEKRQLMANILNIPSKDFDNIAEMAGEIQGDKDASELVLAAIYQADQLSTILNESLNLDDEDSASSVETEFKDEKTIQHIKLQEQKLGLKTSERLIVSSSAINGHLTQLLNIIVEKDKEREQLRAEVKHLNEQLHFIREVRSASNSRPHSLISASSTSEYDPSDNAEHSHTEDVAYLSTYLGDECTGELPSIMEQDNQFDTDIVEEGAMYVDAVSGDLDGDDSARSQQDCSIENNESLDSTIKFIEKEEFIQANRQSVCEDIDITASFI